MNIRRILIVLSSVLIFSNPGFAQPVLPGQTNSEFEALIQTARDNINKQEAVVRSLRKRYENILKRKKQLQEFIDQTNQQIKEAELQKSRPLVKTAKPMTGSLKPEISRVSEKASEKKRLLGEEKERRAQEQKTKKRNAVLEQVLRDREKAMAGALKAREEKAKKEFGDLQSRQLAEQKSRSLQRRISAKETELAIKEKNKKELQAQESARKAQESARQAQEEKDRLKAQIKKQELEIRRNSAMIKQEALAKKKEQEKEALSRKIEKQKLLAEKEKQRILSENECQKLLLLEAEKKAKHEKYVSQLEKLLNRQNCLMAETRQLEMQIQREEENLKVLEKTRQDLIDKLLKNP